MIFNAPLSKITRTLIRQLFIFVWTLLLLIPSCSPTKPSGKTISGKVILEDASDFSGVKVSLFNLPQIDSSILHPLKNYPFLFPSDVNLFFFSHLKQNPIAQTSTDKNGNFSFSDIPEGEYILLLQKEGYGWDYLKISTFKQIPDVNLKKEVYISGTLTGRNVWTKGNYVINGDILIPAGSELIIYDGCIVRINGSYKIKIEGKITAKPLTQEDNSSFTKPIIFTTDDTTITWNGIHIKDGNAEISMSIFRNSITGIYAENSNLTVRGSVFIDHKNYGISASGINSDKTLKISNCIFTSQPIGVYLEFTDTTALIEKSIFTSNTESGVYVTTSGARIKNNYFSGNKYSIKGYSNVSGGLIRVYHNDFVSSSSYHIQLQGQDSEIKYNNINSTSSGISLGDMYLKKTFSIINYNNLQGKKYLLRLGPHTQNTDAKFNYWGTASEAEIKNLIFDRNDVSPTNQNYYNYGIADYSNYFSEPIKQAGIEK